MGCFYPKETEACRLPSTGTSSSSLVFLWSPLHHPRSSGIFPLHFHRICRWSSWSQKRRAQLLKCTRQWTRHPPLPLSLSQMHSFSCDWLLWGWALSVQRLRLEQTSRVDPSSLLARISTEGISQDACVNDLGTPVLTSFPFEQSLIHWGSLFSKKKNLAYEIGSIH